MTKTFVLPHWWKIYMTSCGVLIIATLIGCYLQLRSFDTSAARIYHKAKESRRGSINKAKEQKKSVPFSQERIGITRSFWIEENNGLRRQFFLTAKSAKAHSENITKKTAIKETYINPKGFYQEELYWVISNSGEKVLYKNGCYVQATPPYKKIPERLYQNIIPKQRVRFFDANSGEWDPLKNTLTAHGVFFSIVTCNGHNTPENEKEGETIAQGTSSSITFSLEKRGVHQIHSQGMKLHFNQRRPA